MIRTAVAGSGMEVAVSGYGKGDGKGASGAHGRYHKHSREATRLSYSSWVRSPDSNLFLRRS
jgi:hypothetical protein